MNVTCYCIIILVVGAASSSLSRGRATMEAEERACSGELAELAGCIPYVSGSAKKPTPDCCQSAEKIRASQPKCLCVLIKASTDPSASLPINTSLALRMPSACNIDANVSDCPSILNLPPDSPDAKIFNLGASSDSASGNSTTSSSKTHRSDDKDSTSPSGPASSDPKPASTANNGAKTKLFSAQGLVMMLMGLGAWMVI